jgi:hypothetical protein
MTKAAARSRALSSRPHLSPATHAAIWGDMPIETRRANLLRDRSMRAPVWAPLVDRIARSAYADLTPLQRAMVDALI